MFHTKQKIKVDKFKIKALLIVLLSYEKKEQWNVKNMMSQCEVKMWGQNENKNKRQSWFNRIKLPFLNQTLP